MKRYRLYFTFILLIAVTITSPAKAQSIPGTDFPFARINLRTPPQESPYPGMGNYYSALAKGIETVMWNPASLTAVEHAQSSFSLISGLKAYEYVRPYETEDGEYTFEDQENFKVGYYFTGDEAVTASATREHNSHSFYQTQATGIKFKQALRANEWLVFGILTQSNAGFSLDMSGSFPMIAKTQANFYGSSDFMGTDLAIDNDGYLTYTHTSEGGSTYQYKTVEKIWDGFLDQSSSIPLTVISESRNDISINPGVTLCGAMKWKDLSFGASFTPISATANVNNSARGIIDDGTSDVYIYEPDFDPDDERDALNWVQNPGRYGNETGYKRNTIIVPAGEVIAEGRYSGFYQASALRGDLGIYYEPTEFFSLGMVLENFGGASLNFKGSGRVAYVNSRVSTVEPPAFDPAEEFNWNLFQDDFEPAEGTEDIYLQEKVKVDLPKKLRIGLALKKPCLIAIDYEQNQTPIIFKYIEEDQEKTVTFKNLSFLRIGTENQLFALPFWFRFGLPLMLKPEIEASDQQLQDNIDEIFQFGIIPIGIDLGAEINIYGTHIGSNLGTNASSLLSLYQLDTLNHDLGKLGYYEIFVTHGPWKVTYLATIDPGSSAGAYANRTDKEDKLVEDMSFDEYLNFIQRYARWIQTFTVSYRF